MEHIIIANIDTNTYNTKNKNNNTSKEVDNSGPDIGPDMCFSYLHHWTFKTPTSLFFFFY